MILLMILFGEYEEYQQIKDIIESDNEFANGDGVHFSSLEELDDYLDDWYGTRI